MTNHMEFIKLFLDGVGVFFVLYLIGYSSFLFFSVFAGSSALYRRRYMDQLKNTIDDNYYIPVSILVPAYNEAVTILDSVASLLTQDYPIYEIIIIDDGSQDGTAAKLVKKFGLQASHRPVRRVLACGQEQAIYEGKVKGVSLTVVSKANGGKADALNLGLNLSRYPYFLCIDADSMLQRDSLKKIVLPVLEDNNVVACGGQVRVSNGVKLEQGRVTSYRLPKKWLAAMQVLEYDRSFLASRIFMDRFNGNLIISGAFGLFQKELVLLAGGYATGSLGEDMELVVKLHSFCRVNRLPYTMRYVPEAVCWSQAPNTLRDLMKQRRRWHIGLLESLWKYRWEIGKRGHGAKGVVSFCYFWLYELLSPYIEIFGLLTIALAFSANLINRPFMLLFFCIYAIYGCTLTLIAFFSRIHTEQLSISPKDCFKAVLLSASELFGLRFILLLVRANALLGYYKYRNDWGKLQRQKQHQE